MVYVLLICEIMNTLQKPTARIEDTKRNSHGLKKNSASYYHKYLNNISMEGKIVMEKISRRERIINEMN